jgi:hypothetical protein
MYISWCKVNWIGENARWQQYKKNKTIILLSSEHCKGTSMDEEGDLIPETIMHSNATNSRADILDKLVMQYTCTNRERLHDVWS